MIVDFKDPNGHVTFPSFGLETNPGSNQLNDLRLTMGAVRPVIAEMITRKAYQQDFGICDHSTNDPLDLVRMHPKENIIEGGPRRTWLRKYVNFRIYETTHLNILEFFQLPYDDAVFLAELSEAQALLGNSSLRDLDKQLRGLGK